MLWQKNKLYHSINLKLKTNKQNQIKPNQTKPINQTKSNNKNPSKETDCMGSIFCQAKNGDIAFIVSGTNPRFYNAIHPVLQMMPKINQVNTCTE